MTWRGYTIDLDDEDANYTIGQLLTHLQQVYDRSEYDKVGKLLRRREERIRAEMLAEIDRLKEVAAKETEAEVSRVKVEILAEMEVMRNGLEKSFEKIDKEKENLAQENQRLKREVRLLREMNEELRMREEAEKVRVLELETKVEVEEILRMRAEEDQEYAENMFKELKLRISMLEKQNDMLMTGGGSDSHKTQFMPPMNGLMDAAGCSRQIDVGIMSGDLVDLTEEADGVGPGDTQFGNLVIEDSTSLDPSKRLNESGPPTSHTKNKTKSREPIHIPSDCENDTSDSPLLFKRKRARSIYRECLEEHEPSDCRNNSPKLSIQECKRTSSSSVFSIHPSPSAKGEMKGKAEWEKSILNRLNFTNLDKFSSSDSDE